MRNSAAWIYEDISGIVQNANRVSPTTTELETNRIARIELDPTQCYQLSSFPTLNQTTSHFTSTRTPTIHRRSLKTSQYPSTNAFLKSRMTRHHSTKPHHFIRKPLTPADTRTASHFDSLLTLTK